MATKKAIRCVYIIDLKIQLTPASSNDAPTNPRGIPVAPFVDRVEDYVTDRSEVETTINSFKEMISYARLHLALQQGAAAHTSAGNTSSWSKTRSGGQEG
jgi:hypothetical protein